MKSIHQIFGLWPDRHALAQAIRKPVGYVHNLCRPDRVPTARHDLALWRDAQSRGLPLTLDEFIEAREAADGDGNLPSQGKET